MATSPPGFTSAPRPKHAVAYTAIAPGTLTPSAFSRQESDAHIALLKAKTSLARVESDILDWYKDLREKDLNVETVTAKAPMFAEDYKAAVARRDKAQAAYDAATAEPTRTTGTPAPAGLTTSTVLQGVKTATGVPLLTRERGGSTRKHQTRKHGHTRLRRRARRRVSRRKVTA